MRKPRQLLEGAWYHVTSRLNRGEMLFDKVVVRDLFLGLLAKAKKKYGFQVINFCVMGNHIHLLIRPDRGESLSDIMRWLLGGFSRAFNKMHGLTGHCWGDRFFSRILGGLHQIAAVFSYIDFNPVKAFLVSHSWEWRHGGYWHDRAGILGILETAPPWLPWLKFLREDLSGLPAAMLDHAGK
jgi:putative transposase